MFQWSFCLYQIYFFYRHLSGIWQSQSVAHPLDLISFYIFLQLNFFQDFLSFLLLKMVNIWQLLETSLKSLEFLLFLKLICLVVFRAKRDVFRVHNFDQNQTTSLVFNIKFFFYNAKFYVKLKLNFPEHLSLYEVCSKAKTILQICWRFLNYGLFWGRFQVPY